MRLASAILPILALLAAGCLGGDEDPGRFQLYVTDAPDAIGDFRHLNVTIQVVVVHSKEGGKAEYRPIGERFDLTRLVDGNVSQIIDAPLAPGNYTKVEIEFTEAKGVLVAGGEVPVKAPGNKVFVTSPFEVVANEPVHYVFDIQVHETGKGEYQFKPHANGSGPRKSGPERVVG